MCARLSPDEYDAVAAAAAHARTRPAPLVRRLLLDAAALHQAQPQASDPARRSRRRAYRNRHRVHRVCTELSPAEHAAVTAAANAAGLTPAGFAAELALAAARAHLAAPGAVAVVVPGAASAHDEALLAEVIAVRAALGKIGSNLNQIARAANIALLDTGAQDTPPWNEARVLLRDLDPVLTRVVSAMTASDTAADHLADT